MDLSVWSERHYRVSGFKSFLLSLGANPYRCESCRHNFLSFRRRKERYRPRQAQEAGSGGNRTPGREPGGPEENNQAPEKENGSK